MLLRGAVSHCDLPEVAGKQREDIVAALDQEPV
jgi:hypothetical protein